jgi:hypothetical protein
MADHSLSQLYAALSMARNPEWQLARRLSRLRRRKPSCRFWRVELEAASIASTRSCQIVLRLRDRRCRHQGATRKNGDYRTQAK